MNAARVAELLDAINDRHSANIRWAELFAAREARARARLARLDYYHARRLVCVVLLRAVRQARQGSASAWDWINGAHAKHLASLVELHQWPPTPAQVSGAPNTDWVGAVGD